MSKTNRPFAAFCAATLLSLTSTLSYAGDYSLRNVKEADADNGFMALRDDRLLEGTLHLEYLTDSGASNTWKKNIDSANALGYNTNRTSENCVGARLGIFRRLKATSPFRVGGSVGYVKGPNVNYEVKDTAGFYDLKGKIYSDFTRGLFEASADLPLARWAFIRLGGGIGMAYGRINETLSENVAGSVGWANYHKYWWDETWEGSAGLVLAVSKVQLEFGYRAARYPRFTHSSFYDFSWSPSVYYVGVSY